MGGVILKKKINIIVLIAVVIMASATDYVINPEDQITWKYVSFEPIDLPLEETDEMTMDVMEEPISRKVR